VGGDLVWVGLSVAHTNFILLALPWISIQISYADANFSTTNGPLQIMYYLKNSVGDWELVWPTLIGRNDILLYYRNLQFMIFSSFIVPMTNLWIWVQMCVSKFGYLLHKSCQLASFEALVITWPSFVALQKQIQPMGRRGNQVSSCTTQQQK
jgi:hypothetical protein